MFASEHNHTPVTIKAPQIEKIKKQESANEKDESGESNGYAGAVCIHKQNFRIMLNSENIPFTVVLVDDVLATRHKQKLAKLYSQPSTNCNGWYCQVQFNLTVSQENSRTTLHDQHGDMLKQLFVVCGLGRRSYSDV